MKLSDLGVRVKYGPYRIKVPTARRLVTSLMTSCDYCMTSYTWRHSLQTHRIPKLGTGSTIHMNPLSTHYRVTSCYNKSAHSA